MAKYNVTITEKEIYVVEDIEADNKDEAINKAWEMLTSMDDRSKYWVDSDGESEADEVYE
jgi:hypothetical protein